MARLLAFPRASTPFLESLRWTGRRQRIPALIRGGLCGAMLFVAATVGRILGDNLYEVQAGRVYRSGQLAPERLRDVIHEKQIRTIINLRGCCPSFTWYLQESAVTHELAVSQEDIFLSAIRLPSTTELRRLLEVLDQTDYPILLHCRQGVDRTGLAAVAARLLEDGVSLSQARRQLGVSYGYVPVNGTENMMRFVDLYEAWLRGRGILHSPALFRHWACREYCPGRCRAVFEPVGEGWNQPVTPGRPSSRTLRIHNASVEAWRFRSGSARGVHARYHLKDMAGRIVFKETAGRFEAAVPPGESIDLLIGMPDLPPGRYSLSLDMIDIDENAFCQFGSEPFHSELVVGP